LEPDARVVQLVGEVPRPVKLLEDLPLDRRPENIPYLLAKATAQSTTTVKGVRTAFDCYDALWQLVGGNAKLPALQRYEKILAPALAKIDKVIEEGGDKEFQERVGMLYLAKGRLIKQDHAVNPQLWPRASKDILEAFDKAVEYYKDKEAYAALSRDHSDRSEAAFKEALGDTVNPDVGTGTPVQRQLLARAVSEADEALKDPAQPDYALIAKALALEYQAWLMGDQDSYAEAINTYTKAIDKGERKPEYLLGRGRCYYKRAVGGKDYAVLKDAAVDLKAALQKTLPGSDEVEAYYWLGMVYYKMIPRDDVGLKESWQHAFTIAKGKSFKGNYAYGLEALAATAEFNLEQYTKTRADETLRAAIEQFTDQGTYAQKAKNDKHEFWAWNRLGYIGINYYESDKQYVKAYEVYQRALPANINETTEAHVRVLNDRNSLLARPSEDIQKALRNIPKKPTPDQLIKDAEHCLTLVMTKPRHIWIYDDDVRQANAAAAYCYHQAKDDAKAVKLLEEALKYPQPANEKEVLEGLRNEWKKP
jgi:hypothetical protein